MTIDRCIDNIKLQFNVIDIINCDDYLLSIEDLYSRIKKLHKESYDSTDRLIFTITQDSYKKESCCGIMLESLQAIINDIDISNFFVCVVTSNTKIQDEYNWVLTNVSIDNIPVHIYECDGDYHTLEFTNQARYIKYQKIENIELVDSLSAKHKQLLFQSNNFCMVPWTSMMIDPSSRVRPCCESAEILGDCSKNSLKEIWNSDISKQLRKDMLEGKQPKSCKRLLY